jgi:hypothetical protein
MKKAASKAVKGNRFMAQAYLKVFSAQNLASIISCLGRLGTLAMGRPLASLDHSTIEPA